MNLEIIDTISILGIQDNDVNFLNPIIISISSDTVIQNFTKYKKYRYRFALERRHRCNFNFLRRIKLCKKSSYKFEVN